ncbi:hypothetical protein FRB95_014333 [Tulasnella sp. JGI-2019a]|nr:hypothetical protein FRB93_002708 [Tulasnella sp. JGI-2019a]KAG9038784.1 hypothetical protein FRB95_014333 [Tulasnella sp. JGI-2019a]
MSSSSLPVTTRCIVLTKASSSVKPALHDTSVKLRDIPALKENEVLVKMVAAAFNHREVRKKRKSSLCEGVI